VPPAADQVTDRTKRFIALLLGTASSNPSTTTSTSQPATSPTTAILAKALSDYFKGNESLAKSEFQAIVKAHPTNKFAWYDLGVIAQGAANPKEAEADYSKAISIDPKFESALYNYGVMRFQAGDLTGAVSYLTRAVAADPNDSNARRELVQAIAARTKHT